jgi:cyclophilin family peptidyl-prolyl cis-trans isomerase
MLSGLATIAMTLAVLLPVPRQAQAATSNPPKGQAKMTDSSKSKADTSHNDIVVVETSLGTIEIELNTEKAPISSKNFLKYVDEGAYNDTIFHRVIKGFMIQGGGFTADMKQKPTHAPIENEAANGLKNLRGTLAMARTSDPGSATAQFFINDVDNGFLDFKSATPSGYGYAVFAKVTSGMDVVDKIRNVATTTKGMFENVPTTPVVIKSAKRK